jgi:membrane protein YdbS with pleckstrin-like domain
MIPLNQEQRLGRAAYYLMVSRRTNVGFGILIVAAVLLVAKGGLAGLISTPLSFAGIRDSAAMSANIMNVMTAGLFILALLVCLIGVIIARIEYSNFSFTLEEFDMKLKRGVFTVTEISIPYRQMQDINIERNMMHRFTKTSRVIIDSAGHEEADEKNETDIVLDPIDREVADDIRLMLQRKIGVQVVVGEGEADREAGKAMAA